MGKRENKKAFHKARIPPRERFSIDLTVEDVEHWYHRDRVRVSVYMHRHRPENPWHIGIGVWSIDDFGVNRWFEADTTEEAAKVFDEQVAYVKDYLAELQPLSLAFLYDEGFKVD